MHALSGQTVSRKVAKIQSIWLYARTVRGRCVDAARKIAVDGARGQCCPNAPDAIVELRGKCRKVPAESAHRATFLKCASNSLSMRGLHFPEASRKVKTLRKVDYPLTNSGLKLSALFFHQNNGRDTLTRNDHHGAAFGTTRIGTRIVAAFKRDGLCVLYFSRARNGDAGICGSRIEQT